MNGETAFARLIAATIHECAPDHSIETITVGALREAAATMDGLYEALEAMCIRFGALPAGNEEQQEAFDNAINALAKARGEA